jgi:hypothetical protein
MDLDDEEQSDLTFLKVKIQLKSLKSILETISNKKGFESINSNFGQIYALQKLGLTLPPFLQKFQ